MPQAAVSSSPAAPVTPSLTSPTAPKPLASPRPVPALAPSYPASLMADLKRIGLLTAIALVILIVLYFVLR
jgi:hypothetical protein